MLGDVATATASDWFRLTRQIGTKQLKTQVRLPVGGGRRVQGGAAGRANATPGPAPASTAAAVT